jgi:hexokinase
MNHMKKRVDDFLEQYGMHYRNIDIIRESAVFVEEMNKGLNRESGTLKMLCTHLSPEGEIPSGEPVIVMDAGGTNFRVAVVTFDLHKKPVIEDFQLYPMPGTAGEIGKTEFFETMAGYLAPVITRSQKIGFCFSFPTEILPDKDGKVIAFSKEIKVREINGEKIGANLLHALKERGYETDHRIVLLNDTVATLLGGKTAFPDRRYDSYIGFILGTGTNTCYIEENKKIANVAGPLDATGATIVNIESGGYGKAPRGRLDEKFDSGTAEPGSQQFEKMISGAYQGALLLEIVAAAIAAGLFSEEFAVDLRRTGALTSKQIDEFCFYPYSGNALAKCIHTENDRLVLYYLIDAVFERAAKLVAVNLAAILLQTGKGRNPCLPVCVTAEGTTFYKSKLFRGKLDYYVKECLNDKLDVYCEFVQADHATLVGTAIAGLLN